MGKTAPLITVELDKERHLLFDLNAMVEYEEITGESLLEARKISDIKAKVDGPGVEALAQALEPLGRLIAEIKKLDQSNELILKKKMRQAQEQLKILQEQKKAGEAYQPKPVGGEGAFIDYSK